MDTKAKATMLAWKRCDCGCGCFTTTVLGKTYSVYGSVGAGSQNYVLMLGHRVFCSAVANFPSFKEADAELRKILAPEVASVKQWVDENGHLFPVA